MMISLSPASNYVASRSLSFSLVTFNWDETHLDHQYLGSQTPVSAGAG